MTKSGMRPEPQRGILDIEAYVGGRASAEGAGKVYKLSANETPLGPSPKAREAFLSAVDSLELYPDGGSEELRNAISKRYGLAADRIVCGAGSDELLHLLAQSYLGEGDEAISTEHGFLVYPIVTKAAGATSVVVKEKNLRTDVDAILAAVTEKTKIVFIANPNNPTGTLIPRDEIAAFIASVPSDVVVVLDEAYDEYLDPEEASDSLTRVADHPNLVVCRTFSKAYGLAGLRVGFAVAHPALTDLMNRVRQPFNVNSVALAAAAAVLKDESYLQRSRELNRSGLERLQSAFERMGLEYVPSSGNFVLVRVGDAAAINESLLRAGIIVRPVGNYDLPDWLRISVGLPEENEAFLQAFEQAMGRQ